MKKQDIRHCIKAGTICMNRNRYSYDKLSNGENKDNVKSLRFPVKYFSKRTACVHASFDNHA